MNSGVILTNRILASAILCACLFAGLSSASALLAWGWNDGTTQGWSASTSQSNVGGKFQATNSGNGSLQIFGPTFLRADITERATISFDLAITQYSTVTSPADLIFSRLLLSPPGCPPACPQQQRMYWNLDLSSLAFGQTRRFTLLMKDASVDLEGASPDVAQFDFIFADPHGDSNVSSGLLDNFIVSVPSPAVDVPALRPFQLALIAALILLVAMPRLLRR